MKTSFSFPEENLRIGRVASARAFSKSYLTVTRAQQTTDAVFPRRPGAGVDVVLYHPVFPAASMQHEKKRGPRQKTTSSQNRLDENAYRGRSYRPRDFPVRRGGFLGATTSLTHPSRAETRPPPRNRKNSKTAHRQALPRPPHQKFTSPPAR